MKKTTIKKYTVILITAIFIITSFIPVAGLSTISRIDESSFDGSEEIIIPEIAQANSKGYDSGEHLFDMKSTSSISSDGFNPLPLRAGDDWWNSDWMYRKEVTINHEKVEESLSNFPVLISLDYDNDLSSHAQPDGADIVFIDVDGNKLNHEIELYDSLTGELVSWINVTNLSGILDTTLYMYYSNLYVSNQQNVESVWDSNYVMVQHLEETDDNILDSTINNNDGLSVGTMFSEDGRIGGGRYYTGNDTITVNDFTHSANALSAEAWIYRNDASIIRIFSKGENFDESDWVLYLRTSSFDEGIDFGVNNHTSRVRAGNTSEDSWFHLTATYDAGNVVLYVNGTQVGSGIIDTSINNSFADLGLGNDNDGGRPWNGLLDELRVSNIARNSSWVKTSFNTMNDPDSFFNLGSEQIFISEEPMVFNPNPVNGSSEVDISLSMLSFNLTDFQGDLMNYSVETTPNIGHDNANGVINGSYNVSVSNLEYDTIYTWYVNVTDSLDVNIWTNATFSFTTKPENYDPVLSHETPTNGSTMVYINPILSVNVTDLDEEPITVIFSSNSSGMWQDLGKYDGGNGIYSQSTSDMYDLNTTYYWSIHVTDGKVWTNATFHFTTSDSVVLTLKWYNDTVSGRTATGPLAADVTGNGKMEVIRSGENGVVVLDGETGVEIWSFPEALHNDHCPVEIIDLNKDNILELIFAYDAGLIALHGNNGSVYWFNPDASLYNKYAVAGDIDADGYPEIYVAVEGSITALTHDGHIFATTYTYYPCFSGLSLGDTDQDGVFELYLNERSDGYGSGEGLGIRAFWASNLTSRWNRPDILCSSHCPTLVDVDGDGKLDVVSAQQSGGGVIVLNSTDGSEMHYTKNIPGMGAHSQPTIHDIDNDGNLEIIVSRRSAPVVWDLVEWDYDAILPYVCKEPPAVADITGDGNVEILASTANNVTIFNNKYEIIGTLAISDAHAFIVAQDVDNDGLIELVINQEWQTSGGVYVYDTFAPAPTPRALSQYQFYSPHRGRSPYYTQYGPDAPVLKDETPSNGAMNYSINPILSVYIYDYQQDLMNITFSTNASGIWKDLENYTNVQNGTHTVPTSDMNSIDTVYWWRVNVTDSTGHSRSEVFTFETTRTRPVLSNPSPQSGGIHIEFQPDLSIDANCYFGPTMNIEFWTNASGTWAMFGSNLSVINGRFICDNTDFVNSYFKKYWWSVNASDLGTGNWTNKTYYFTTEATKVDTISPYEHISPPISISASGSSDLDNVSLYYRYSDKNWTNDRITLTYDGFEGESFNLGNWSDAGSDCKSYTSGEYAYDGNNSLNLEDDSSTAFTQLTNGLDLDTPGYTQIIIDFWAYYTSIESGESLEVFFDRTSVWTFYPNGYEDQFIHHTIWINETDYEFGSDVKIRFEAEFSASNDDVYLDQIHIQATNNIKWTSWNSVDNPDLSYPWSWDFNFPQGTGYYEFFTSGMHNNIVYDAIPDYPDAICNFINQIPTITSFSPLDNEVDVSIFLSEISFTIIDDQTDSMDYTITTTPDIIGGSQSDSNVESGSIINIPIITSPLQYATTYTWSVNLTDGMHWNNQTYHFTTRSAPAPWWDTNWQYRQEIIVDHAKVVGDLINFPIFVNIQSDSNLKDHVQPDGDDIVFIDSAGTILNHEIEHYDSNTGTLIAWVNVPHLSSTSNTIMYLYYGNSDAPNQENIEEVWDADYVSVHHFQETLGLHQDSTAHDNDTTVVQVTEQGVLDGIAGGCDMFNGSDYIQFPTKQFTAGKEEVTIEVWVNPEIISNSVTIYDEWNAANYWQYTLRFDNFNTRDVHGGPEESRDNDISWIISQPTPNTWNYVTTWYSVAVEEKRLYFNGSVDSFSYTNIDVLTEERNESSPRLGFASDGQNFTGKMDEFRVSKVARTTEWLKTTYNTMSSPHTFLSVGSEHTKDIYLLDENYSISLSVGWNLISLLVNQSFDKNDITVNYLDVNYTWGQAVDNETILDFVYGWNTAIQNHVFSDVLTPGEGYWVYANQVCDLWISSNISQNDEYITDLIAGWNLVGIPYNESVYKENLSVNYNGIDYTWELAVENDIVLAFSYGWDTGIQNYIFTDVLESDKGYWIYANENCSLHYFGL